MIRRFTRTERPIESAPPPMRRLQALLLPALLLPPAMLLPAHQLWCQAALAHNKLEHGNRFLTDTELLFPNYLKTGGNVAGDALFKVLPREVLERQEAHQLSGYRLALSVDNAYTGQLPKDVKLPALQLYYTTVLKLPANDPNGKTYEVPDLQR